MVTVACITDRRGNVALVDEQDYERYSEYRWLMMPNGYFSARVGGPSLLLHRVIMGNPQGMDVDHINHDKADCRKINLRICTRHENARNRPTQSNNRSGYKGVGWHRKNQRWRARVRRDGRTVELGYFDTPEEAYAAYCMAAEQIHGDYCCVG